MWCCRSRCPLLSEQESTTQHEPAYNQTGLVSETLTVETDGHERTADIVVTQSNGNTVQELQQLATTGIGEEETDNGYGGDQTDSSTRSSVEPRSKHIAIIVQPQKLSDLSFPEGKAFQERYRGYWAYVIAIVLFYAIPTYQLVLTYQRVRGERERERDRK